PVRVSTLFLSAFTRIQVLYYRSCSTPACYTPSLHDALPIWGRKNRRVKNAKLFKPFLFVTLLLIIIFKSCRGPLRIEDVARVFERDFHAFAKLVNEPLDRRENPVRRRGVRFQIGRAHV